MIAALNRFVSKLADRCQPFYQLLKKWKWIQWTEEYEAAFRDLKKYLVSPSILSCLDPGDDLYMYLTVSEHAVSVVMFKRECRGRSIISAKHGLTQKPGIYH